MIRAILTTVLLVLSAGCSRNPDTAAQPPPSNATQSSTLVRNTITVKGVRITAEESNATISHSSAPEREIVEIGEHMIELQGSELTVNGQSYGSVRRGAEVKITPDGAVFVNGEQRSPQ